MAKIERASEEMVNLFDKVKDKTTSRRVMLAIEQSLSRIFV